VVASASAPYRSRSVKTRTLIALSLACGMALLVAFTVQILMAR